ncbi:MAG: 4-alpha-glucanotransferase [Clostridia bacterium]|nr:4-alpha-glucanotransferase [Clostridia bacterium]
MGFQRSSGILLHPTSLPGKYGIGDLGREAYEFIDFLTLSGQKLWQVLPLVSPIIEGSPYLSISAFAMNPLLINPDKLIEIGLLLPSDISSIPDFDECRVEHNKVREYKAPLIFKAIQNLRKSSDKLLEKKFECFCERHAAWLDNYALFLALKEHNNYKEWNEWKVPVDPKNPSSIAEWNEKLKESVFCHKAAQFLVYSQWLELKFYANLNGIKIIGDLPIFIAYGSSDVWANPEYFKLDEKGYPLVVSGAPPDIFCSDGQKWGSPIYNWEAIKEDGYKWWVERSRNILEVSDIFRIDHFRGFAQYWEIPASDSTAKNGKWVPGPGEELFHAIEKELGKLPIIAEDLGYITRDVMELREKLGFPGMNVLQFGFSEITEDTKRFLPHNHERNSVVYTGTHDNDTTWGAYSSFPENIKIKVRKYLNTSNDTAEICWDFIRSAFSSVADMAIIPMQDILCLGNEAKMNYPWKAEGNWAWRYKKAMLNEEIAKRLYGLTRVYHR